MKQGGLWVCASKTVCGLHVYQKKMVFQGPSLENTLSHTT
jgi:hypothetical protein